MTAVRAAQSDDSVTAIVVVGAGSTFVAGADIREFGRIVAGERPMIALNPLSLLPQCMGQFQPMQ